MRVSQESLKKPQSVAMVCAFPFINGERAPYWTSDIKASYHGLTIQHTRADMIRGAIEGCC